MKFLHPNFLWALLCLAIPLIIHLFHFRRYKRVLFSNTKFLSEIKDEQSTRNKLKHLLVLLTRMLAVLFLVLAFAQPFIPSSNKGASGEKLISVYLDNSFSMQTEGQGYLLFEEAKLTAQQVIEAYTENNKFQILSNDFEAKHQRIVEKSEALNMLSEIQISTSNQQKELVFEKQKVGSKKFEGEKIFYQLSDFQKQNELLEADKDFPVNLVYFSPSVVRNISIEEVWFDAPVQLLEQHNKLLLKFRNQSDEEQAGSYQLSLNGIAKSIGNYTIPANSYIIDTVQFTIAQEGWNEGKIAINDYPLTFDDSYYFSFFVEKQLNVYCIYEGAGEKYPRAVFENNSQVQFQSSLSNNINYTDLKQQHLVVVSNVKTISSGLNESLSNYLKAGGQVLFIPNADGSVASYNQFLSSVGAGIFSNKLQESRKVTAINLEQDLLVDIFEEKPTKLDLPQVNTSYVLQGSLNQERVLSFADGSNYLSATSIENGNLYILTSPLGNEHTNFTQQAIFAPICYKMAVLGAKNSNIAYVINANTNLILNKLPNNNESLFRIANEEIQLIPQKTNFNGQVLLSFPGEKLESGFYTIKVDDEDYEVVAGLNYNRMESDLSYYPLDELEETYSNTNVKVLENNLASIQDNAKQLEDGKSFWKLCIILALVFLALEILLLRFIPN